MADYIAGFQCLNNPNDKVTFKDVDEKSNEVKKHIESSLETKLSEYAILMDKRDEDLSLLKSEIIDLEKELKGSKNNIFEEQKKFIELQMKKNITIIFIICI